jgi:hypothetical protein
MVFAQNAAPATQGSNNGKAAAKGSSTAGDEYPDLVEIDPFGGVSVFGGSNTGLGERYADGGVAGLRVDVNVSRHIGIEVWGDWAENNVSFIKSTGVYPAGSLTAAPGSPLPSYSFGNRVYSWGLNPVFNLRPRGSKIIPYLTVGIGGAQFTPTREAKSYARA